MPATPVLRFLPPPTAPVPPEAPLTLRAQPATPPDLRPSSLAMKASRRVSSPSPEGHQLPQGALFRVSSFESFARGLLSTLRRASVRRPQVQRYPVEQQQNATLLPLRLFYLRARWRVCCCCL